MSGSGFDYPSHLIYRSLESAVTDLAFEGHHDAPGEALRRLCEGEWLADGQWKWRAWAGAIFQTEGTGRIPAARWSGLQLALMSGLDGFTLGQPLPTFSNGFSFRDEMPHYETADWGWCFNRFETAMLIGPDREEWFHAVDISICVTPGIVSFPATPAIEPSLKGGRPPKWDWIEATLAMAGLYHLGDLKPATVADVIKAIQGWASSGGMDEPPDSTARPYATRILQAFRAWEKAD